MTDPDGLGPFKPDDPLGRGVFSRSRAERARTRGLIAHDIFLERFEATCLSVDRLDHVPDAGMTAVADQIGAERGQRFFGWATLSVAQAATPPA